jgi:hypothetical protein
MACEPTPRKGISPLRRPRMRTILRSPFSHFELDLLPPWSGFLFGSLTPTTPTGEGAVLSAAAANPVREISSLLLFARHVRFGLGRLMMKII